ncbi:RNA polymerase sigma factor [Rubritalea tangerina]|uniref:RNA polymerase sigma factor n=2 Tax=Rubritalea tangerina TaxID=430798 RepID=A0ABW4ZBN2_9BACT
MTEPVPMKLMGNPKQATRSAAEHSLEECFRDEESPLLRYAYALVRRREVAEELVQEAFMRAHQHWGQMEQPRAWLYRAVRNLALNYLRKHRRESIGDEEAGESNDERPDRCTDKLETAAKLRALMSEMSESDQELIRLKYEEELSYAGIAEKLEIGVGNVGYRLHHILKSLGEGLKRVGVEGTE